MPVHKKPFYRRLLEFRLFFVVNAVILVLLALSFGREFLRNMEIQHDIADLKAQATSLEAKSLEIAQLNTAFQTESYIEREARLKLGLKKPGEEVVVVQEGSGMENRHEELKDPVSDMQSGTSDQASGADER